MVFKRKTSPVCIRICFLYKFVPVFLFFIFSQLLKLTIYTYIFRKLNLSYRLWEGWLVELISTILITAHSKWDLNYLSLTQPQKLKAAEKTKCSWPFKCLFTSCLFFLYISQMYQTKAVAWSKITYSRAVLTNSSWHVSCSVYSSIV